MRIALLHYWLLRMRGGEKVLKELCSIFPSAHIFTHVYDSTGVDPLFHSHRIRCSFIGAMPFSRTSYNRYLPLMPVATKLLKLKEYDLIISSESGPIKGITKPSRAVHVCYCHTPMRYIWDMYDDYFAHAGLAEKFFMTALKGYLRKTDQMSADSVDCFAANSKFVAERIERIYKREATVIYPPVDTEFFRSESREERGDYYLLSGHLSHYKRPDIAIEAFNKNGRRLIVAGTGEELAKSRKMARQNISFVGSVDDLELRRLYAEARALIFPGIEDFGLVPVEAQACGTPVIAYGRGGALETVVEGETGLFFREHSAESLCEAIEEFESGAHIFKRDVLREHAEKFSAQNFRESFKALVLEKTGRHSPEYGKA